MSALAAAQCVSSRRQRLAPGHLDERVPAAGQGAAEPVLAVDGPEAEPALVAQPAPVDRVDVHALVAKDLVAAGLDEGAAPDRAARARALDLLQVPRAGLEPVGRGGERAHGADLDRVAAEVAGEGVIGEGVDLGLVPAVLEVDEGVAGDLVREPRAAVAEDAPLPVERHQVADHDRLLEVALLLDEAALAGSVGERLVLQGALAALVAHGAVQRVVDQEELEDAVLGLLRDLALRVDHHVRGHGDHAGRLERRAATGVDLDDAHAAHPDRLHPRVVAEARDVGAVALRGLDDELARLGLDLLAVDRHDHGLRRCLGLRHEPPRRGRLG